MRKWRDESGQVLVMVALLMTVLLGFVAFATDVGLMLRQRRMAQTAADSAALAAVTESLYEGNPSYVTSGIWDSASHDVMLNGFTPGTSNGVANSDSGVTLTINLAPNISVPSFNYANYAQATISMNTKTVFMNVFGIHSMNVGATAVASNDITSDGCIYVQNPTGLADPALDMGGNSLIASPDCAVSVNGNIDLGGNSKINAKYVAATGTIEGKNAGDGWAPNSSPQNDPLSKLSDPANQPQPPSTPGDPCTAPAGSGMSCVYNYGCSSTSTSCLLKDVNLDTVLQPNTVFYYDKPLVISGNVSGTSDTIYLATPTSYLNFNHVGTLTLSPPGTACPDGNPLCGVVIDAPTVGSNDLGTYTCSAGNGNNGENPGEIYFDFGSSTTTITGVIYAPYMELFVQDQGAYTTLNADLVIGNICAQSGSFTVNGYSGPGSPLTRMGLVF